MTATDEEFLPPALISAGKITDGIKVLAKYSCDLHLVALDAEVLCRGPTPGNIEEADMDSLAKLGWTWGDYAWSFYTGH